MNFIPLASSSAGNAYLLEDGQTKLLLECGIPYRRLQKLTGFGTAGIAGCLMSHEHQDHAKCYLELIKNGVPVYSGAGTADALGCDLIIPLESRMVTTIGTFEVLPFATFHDAAEPLGFFIRSTVDGERIMFATDTVNLGYQFQGVNIAALECNYSAEILDRATKLPEKVRIRISNNHMEVGRACAYLERVDLSLCRKIYLLHLSDACANEGDFVERIRKSCPGIEVTACQK